MQKMSLIHVLMTFYKKNTMVYVGKYWRGTGILVLFGLCAYCAIFIAYSWNKHAKSTYENFYRPVLANIPPVKYSDGHFQFDAELPVKVEHPITGNKAVYIDTSIEKIPEEAYEYRAVITKNEFIISDIPMLVRSHDFKHDAVFFPFIKSPFEGGEYINSDELVAATDASADKAHLSIYSMVVVGYFVMELCKTLFITVIVMLMFKNGAIKTTKHRNFKLVNRLCIITYIPVLLTNSLHYFLLTTPGIFTVIFTSFIHIILLMIAIHMNVMEDLEENVPKL